MKKNKIPHQVRQGDVLIHPVKAIPAGVKPLALESGRVILAHGEVTGHHHSFAGDGATALLEAPTGQRFLSATEERSWEHQEHAPIPVAPDSIAPPRQVIRQREWTSASAARKVAD